LFTPQSTVLHHLNQASTGVNVTAPSWSRANAKHTSPVDFLLPELELRRFEAPSKSFGDSILGYDEN